MGRTVVYIIIDRLPGQLFNIPLLVFGFHWAQQWRRQSSAAHYHAYLKARNDSHRACDAASELTLITVPPGMMSVKVP